MTTITFDTLKFVQTLEKAGVPYAHAEAFAEVFKQAQGEAELVTKPYLNATLDAALAPLRTDLAVLKWMMGLLLAGVMALILKNFF